MSEELKTAQQTLYYHWGEMASKWGINRTMAQLHALLYVTGEAMTMDDLIQRLTISRGNASMNLRELMEWGVVRRVHKPGDRKEYYVAEQDVWVMFFRVLAERKRREIDPTVVALNQCLKMTSDKSSEEFEDYKRRVQSLLEVFTLFDSVFKLVNENNLHELRALLKPELLNEQLSG